MSDVVEPLVVAIQGEQGAFSHQAALDFFGPGLELLPRPTFDALFAAVTEGAADRAIVPIENSLAGSVHENYDRLWASTLHVVGEAQVRIRLCLIGRPGSSLKTIRRVASHPVALAQCRTLFVQHPGMEAVAAYDTAGSVMDLLRSDGPVTQAAIASRLAAELYGGTILLEGIEDHPENYTRFLVLAREPRPRSGSTKTSLVFTLENSPGVLYRALGFFAERGLDLTKIESRPLRGKPWEYAFYLDVTGDPEGPLHAAIDDLRAIAPELRILGSYPDRRDRTGGDFGKDPEKDLTPPPSSA
jgi:prephenate dehydratase